MQIHTSTPPSLPDNDVEDNYRLHRRFDRMGRLVGDDGMKTLFASHVMVIGLGGVGSHAAEALVRSGGLTVAWLPYSWEVNAQRP